MKKKIAPVVVQFTEAEKAAMQSAARAVWDECGYDVLQAVAEEKGQDINAISIPVAEVLEMALDAGRMEDRLRRSMVTDGRRARTDVRATGATTHQPVITPDLLTRIAAASGRSGRRAGRRGRA